MGKVSWCVAGRFVAGDESGFSEGAKLIKRNLSFVKNLSERLDAAIRSSGMSKGEFASRMHVPQSSVSRWLAGSEPRAEKICEIAKFLSVEVKWLMDGIGPMRRENPGISQKEEPSSLLREEARPMPDLADPFMRIAIALERIARVMEQSQGGMYQSQTKDER